MTSFWDLHAIAGRHGAVATRVTSAWFIRHAAHSAMSIREALTAAGIDFYELNNNSTAILSPITEERAS